MPGARRHFRRLYILKSCSRVAGEVGEVLTRRAVWQLPLGGSTQKRAEGVPNRPTAGVALVFAFIVIIASNLEGFEGTLRPEELVLPKHV